MLTGRRYLLKLTAEQAGFAERIGGVCRSVWNTALEQRREYRRRGAVIGYREQARQLAEAKREQSLGWLAEVPSHCLQQTLIDLDEACARHGTWKVRWKSKTRSRPSFRFPEGGKIAVQRLNRRWARARLPKLGWVRFRWTGRWAGLSGAPPSPATGSTGTSPCWSTTASGPLTGTPTLTPGSEWTVGWRRS